MVEKSLSFICEIPCFYRELQQDIIEDLEDFLQEGGSETLTSLGPALTSYSGATDVGKPETGSETACGEGVCGGVSPSHVGPPPYKGGTDTDVRLVLLDGRVPLPLLSHVNIEKMTENRVELYWRFS